MKRVTRISTCDASKNVFIVTVYIQRKVTSMTVQYEREKERERERGGGGVTEARERETD